MQKAVLLMHISISKVQMYTLLYVGILIERDRFEMFELLRIWSISQYLAAPFSHCNAMIDNVVHNSGPYFIWYAPLSSSASSSILPLYPSMHPYSSSSSRLLTLIVSWMFIHCQNLWLLCCPLSIYAFQLKVHEMHLLSYFRELVCHWLIYILFISQSQDSLAQFMANLQKV